MLVLGSDEVFLSLALLELLPALAHLLLDLLECFRLLLFNLKSLIFAVLDHAFEVSLLFVELLAVVVVFGIDLVKLIEF